MVGVRQTRPHTADSAVRLSCSSLWCWNTRCTLEDTAVYIYPRVLCHRHYWVGNLGRSKYDPCCAAKCSETSHRFRFGVFWADAKTLYNSILHHHACLLVSDLSVDAVRDCVYLHRLVPCLCGSLLLHLPHPCCYPHTCHLLFHRSCPP